eukprot:5279831-Prorocentrum_lima.AAC.1
MARGTAARSMTGRQGGSNAKALRLNPQIPSDGTCRKYAEVTKGSKRSKSLMWPTISQFRVYPGTTRGSS